MDETEPDTIYIRLKDLAKQMPLSLKTGVHHKIVLTPPHAFVLDTEDAHFNVDRCVLLPEVSDVDGSTPELDLRRMKGIDVVYAGLAHADKHPGQGLMVTGHTDRSGSASYNQKLSDARARNVSLLLHGKRKDWSEQAASHDAVDDYQTVLKWQADRAGWDCDPGPVNNKLTKRTRDAIKAFQIKYNEQVEEDQGKSLDSPFKKKINPDGKVGKETWGAIYDVYMSEIMRLLDLDKFSELQARQDKVKAPPGMPEFTGCGEHVPYKSTLRNSFEKAKDEHVEGPPHRVADRRVSLLFFDPGEEVKLPCRAKSSDCKPDQCTLYVKDRYQLNPIGIPKGLALLEANLRLTFVDPQGKIRPLPAGIKVEVHFGDPKHLPPDPNSPIDPFDPGAPATAPAPPPPPPADGSDDRVDVPQTSTVETGPDGILQFAVARSASSLCLRFVPGKQQFVTADPDDLNDQKLVDKDALTQAVNNGRVFFQLPAKFTTLDGRWIPAPELKFKDGKFTEINDRQTQIGSREKPAELKLDVAWQYFRFDYFDRFTATPATVPSARSKDGGDVPPLALEGFVFPLPPASVPDSSEVRSAWDIKSGDDTVYCLGWVRRLVPEQGDARELPDEKCTVRFSVPRGGKRLFVRTEGDGKDAKSPRTVVAYERRAAEVTTPGVERLRLYDLPTDWRSNDYPVGFPGDDATKLQAYEKVVATKSAADKPYVVSLDIIVLGGDTDLEPDADVVWDDKIENRFGIRDNTLAVFKPHEQDTYFTKLSELKPAPTTAVLIDHPPFTRLITRGKYLYEVFDARVVGAKEFEGFPIGARLARRFELKQDYSKWWIPSVSVDGPFFHMDYVNPAPKPDGSLTDPGYTGHAALGMLRCCGHEGDVELFRFFNYITVRCNYSPPPKANATQLTSAVNQADGDVYLRDCLLASAARWNGSDSYNTSPPSFEVGKPMVAKGTWTALLVPGASTGSNQALLTINVYKEIRACIYNITPDGQWTLDDMKSVSGGDNDGWFTAAHELGHVMGQPDEYTNGDYEPSLYYPNITESSRSPGEPYGFDDAGMMTGNRLVRTRSYWHIVLWAHDKKAFVGDPTINIQHGTYNFTTEVKDRNNSRVQWPVFTTPNPNATAVLGAGREWSGKPVGTMGLCDQFVYLTGKDAWIAGYLPGSSPEPYDGVIIVRVKMAWTFSETSDYDKLRSLFSRAKKQIDKTFNAANGRRLVFRGRHGATPVRLRVLFAPRFICCTFPTDGDDCQKFLKSIDWPPLAAINEESYQKRVTTSIKDHGIHADITVVAKDPPGVTGTDLPRKAILRPDPWFLSWRFDDDALLLFSQLIGLPDANVTGPQAYRNLFKALEPDFVGNPEFTP